MLSFVVVVFRYGVAELILALGGEKGNESQLAFLCRLVELQELPI